MALKQNIIYVYFKGKHLVTSKSQYQYNHGQFLYFADLDLPQAFEVHFSNTDRGYSKPKVGSNRLVEIPDEYYWSGALQIYAWIYLHSDIDDGETIYEVKIPLIKRAKPTDEEPLPQQESAMERAIAELNNAVEITTENANKTGEDRTEVSNIRDEVVDLKEDIDATAETVEQKTQNAIDASRRSEASAQNAAEYEEGARIYSENAEQSAQEALESKNTAKQKAEVATDASAEALGYRDEALEAKDQAIRAKQNIVDYRDETKGYRDETLNIKNDVQTLKGQVEDIADDVSEDAQSASQSASSASQSANSASQSANSANQSANSASQSANQAEQFKNQSETNVTHYPKVVDGYWYVWDANSSEYVNTNIDARGIKGDVGESGVYIGTEEPSDENVNVWIDMDEDAESFVNDVQINGTSIVQNGVANVPLATKNNIGVEKIGFGLQSYYGISISSAATSKIKTGSEQFEPITPRYQHASTFYGLAKASGDTTQSASSNAVGNYTDEAKAKIQTMLGIADIIGNSEGATASQAYSVGDVFLYSGKLYKATASITQGSAIVPNTNCTQTTIIDLLRGV